MSHLSRQYVKHYYRVENNKLVKEDFFKPSVYAQLNKIPLTGFEPNGKFPITDHDKIGFRGKKKRNTTKRRMKRVRKSR